jgi:hypothetical protein
VSRADSQKAIEQDILRERAGALSRAFEALEQALRAIAELDARPARGPSAAEERRSLVRAAGERLWYVVVQREAMGLLRHDVVYDVLRIPREVRSAMGPNLTPAARGRR